MTSFFKTQFLFLFAVSLSFLVACTPKDKDLHRPYFNKQGGAPNGLRIGAYGQPIWALQNIEQAGTLMQLCLKSEDFPVKNSQGKTTKTCQIHYVHDFPTSVQSESQMNQTWEITLALKDNGADHSIISAKGNLEQGRSTRPYRGLNSYLAYQNKTFSYEVEGDSFSMNLEARGEIGSEKDQIEFTQSSHSKGLLMAQAWELDQFDHQLVLPNRNQKFQLSSNSLRLSWVSPLCAEPTGEVQAIEQGKRPARILLDVVIAKQILDNGREGWKSATFKNCQERSQALPNFEFLFY